MILTKSLNILEISNLKKINKPVINVKLNITLNNCATLFKNRQSVKKLPELGKVSYDELRNPSLYITSLTSRNKKWKNKLSKDFKPKEISTNTSRNMILSKKHNTEEKVDYVQIQPKELVILDKEGMAINFNT